VSQSASRSSVILQAFLSKKAVPQALLFQGAEGSGKRAAARLFAKRILCSGPASSDSTEGALQACGACLSCRKIKNRNHPDFSMLAPLEAGKAIKIDQVRQIQQQIFFKPIDGPKKILLIDPADKMNVAAANSLLKLLEEPPAHAILILISAQADSLLPTLLSRCQKIVFQALSLVQVTSAVMAQNHCQKAEARLIAATAQGQLEAALALKLEDAKTMDQDRHRLISSGELFQAALEFSRDSDLFQQALFYLRAWLRDALVCKAFPLSEGPDPEHLIFSWRRTALQAWADKRDFEDIQTLLTALQAVHFAQSRNINRQLSLEVLLLKIHQSRRCTMT